jgi:hypothetical protein
MGHPLGGFCGEGVAIGHTLKGVKVQRVQKVQKRRFLRLTGPVGRRVLRFDGPTGRGLWYRRLWRR